MRKYADNDEHKIRLERQVREWLKSGLIDQAQHDAVSPDFKTELRRTNLFLRLILFGFASFIIVAAVLLVGIVSGVRDETGMASIALISAAAAFVLAEFLIGEFQLYRFGVEEAAAFVSAVLAAVGVTFLNSSAHLVGPELFAFLVAGAIAAFVVYLRFGYLYAAVASMLCAGLAPFQLRTSSEVSERLIAAAVLAIVFIVSRSLLRDADPEFPGDEYRTIQAIALAGVYATLNTQLLSFFPPRPFFYGAPLPLPFGFYWFTYLMIWLLPVIGLHFGLRDKDRPLIDVSILLGLVTLMTNKPYLGGTRQTWDPILFGFVLIATAIAVRRWLSKGENGFRHGYTAERLLSSDKRKLSIAGTAAAFASFPATHATANAPRTVEATDGFKSDGGRSGGAGASGSF